MASPQISFRLSAYQIARGLKIIRALEPGYMPSSISQLVKTLCIDYLAKTSLNKSDKITEADIAEVHNLIACKGSMSLADFQQATRKTKEPPTNKSSKPAESTESNITSVSDFSPPTDWLKE